MKNKGFMMAEVVIVSVIVLVVLGGMFISFNNIYSSYKSRSSYYDSISLYQLVYYRDILIENDIINSILTRLKNNKIISVYNSNDRSKSLFELPVNDIDDRYEDSVFLVYSPNNVLDEDIFNDDFSIHPKFNDYVNFIHESTKINSNYVMIMERCMKSDVDNCKYGYLEIYDGYE